MKRTNSLIAILFLVTAVLHADNDLLSKYYTNLVSVQKDPGIKDFSLRTTLLEESYTKTITPNQKNLSNLKKDDLHALFMSAELLFFYTMFSDYENNDSYLKDMQKDFLALQERSEATEQEYIHLYQALVTSRKFNEANNLATTKKAPVKLTVPEVHYNRLKPGQLAVLTLKDGSENLYVNGVTLNPAMQLVVVANCHFATDAVRDIHANKEVLEAFRKSHAVWLSPSNGTNDLDKIEEWNKKFPDSPLAIAYSNAAWNGVDFTESPTFYFYKNGHLVKTERGWRRDGHVPDKIINGLKLIGAL